MISSNLRGVIEVVLGSILYGLIGIFARALKDLPTGSVIFYRQVFAAGILFLYLMLSGRTREIRLREKKGVLLLLGLSQAGAMLAYFTAIKLLTVSMAVLLLYTSPIHVTLLSPLVLKEPITPGRWGALLLSMAGVVLIVWPGSGLSDFRGTSLVGMVAGLLSGIGCALIVVSSRSLGKSYSGLAQATWAVLIPMAVFLPWSTSVPLPLLGRSALLLFLFGLLPTALALILNFNGLGRIRAQSASLIALLEPVTGVVLSHLFLGEQLSARIIVGGGLILLGALAGSRQ